MAHKELLHDGKVSCCTINKSSRKLQESSGSLLFARFHGWGFMNEGGILETLGLKYQRF